MTKANAAMLGIASLMGIVVVGFGALHFAGIAEAAAEGSGPATPASPNATPVLLELFTSEGCSSCPSADTVAAKLARTQSVPNARVIVLAHHVDYWNSLGWPDPFSSTAATSRQRGYASLGGGSYTPQAVIDGRAEMVGSRSGAIEDAITASAKRTHVKIDLVATPRANQAGAYDVTAKLASLPDGTASDAELMIAVVQDKGHVAVPRGENGGRTLDHVGIARSLTIAGAAKSNATLTTTVQLPALVNAPDGKSTFSVIAFIQEKSSRHVLGTATTNL